jgi:hypothetical protein
MHIVTESFGYCLYSCGLFVDFYSLSARALVVPAAHAESCGMILTAIEVYWVSYRVALDHSLNIPKPAELHDKTLL